MKRTKKVRRLRFWLFIFKTCSFLVSVMPLGAYFLVNFERYVTCTRDVWKLSAGAVIICIVMLLKVLGKLKVPGRLVASVLTMGMCWLFSALLADLLIISAIWCVSEVADFIIFSPIAKAISRKLLIHETALATAQATKEVLGG